MYWKWFWKALSFLLVLSIFIAGGIAIYRTGYSHGVTEGLWAAESAPDIPMPYHRYYHRPSLLLPFTGLFLFFIFLMVLFGGFRRHIYDRRWKLAGIPSPEEFKRHWSRSHRGHTHPHHWWDPEDADSQDVPTADKAPNKSQPDAESNSE